MGREEAGRSNRRGRAGRFRRGRMGGKVNTGRDSRGKGGEEVCWFHFFFFLSKPRQDCRGEGREAGQLHFSKIKIMCLIPILMCF